MAKSHKLLSFEGLRGVAAFAVVISHLHLTFYAPFRTELHERLAFLPYAVVGAIASLIEGLYSGAFAVWLFWIMSAFVLSLQFFLRANQIEGPRPHDYLEDACLRRYPRLLLPVFASVLFAYAILALGWMHNLRLANVLGGIYQTGWLGSWYHFTPSFHGAIKSAVWQCFFNYDVSTTYNPVLWTMQPELLGSMFLFAFLGLLGHRRSRFFAYPILATVITMLKLHWLNAFVAGIALCDVFVNHDKLLLGQYPRLAKAFALARNSPWPAILIWMMVILCAGIGNHGVLYLVAGAVAVATTLISIPTQKLLSRRIPVFLGKISFALYLIHLPLICSFSCWAYLRTVGFMGPKTAALVVSVVTVVLSIALGYALYLIADRPSLSLSRRISSAIMNTNWSLFKKRQPASKNPFEPSCAEKGKEVNP